MCRRAGIKYSKYAPVLYMLPVHGHVQLKRKARSTHRKNTRRCEKATKIAESVLFNMLLCFFDCSLSTFYGVLNVSSTCFRSSSTVPHVYTYRNVCILSREHSNTIRASTILSKESSSRN